MKKIIVPGIVAGLVNLVASFILSQVTNILWPSLSAEYINSAIFRPWSDPLMSLYFLYPFLLGFVLAWVWDKTHKLIAGKTDFDKAYKFGLSYWLVAGLPGMFITYSSFQVSLALVLSWTISGLVEGVLAGWVFARLIK